MQESSLITESECKQYIAGPLEDDTCKGSLCTSEDYRQSGKYSENKKCEGMLNGAGDKALTVHIILCISSALQPYYLHPLLLPVSPSLPLFSHSGLPAATWHTMNSPISKPSHSLFFFLECSEIHMISSFTSFSYQRNLVWPPSIVWLDLPNSPSRSMLPYFYLCPFYRWERWSPVILIHLLKVI